MKGLDKMSNSERMMMYRLPYGKFLFEDTEALEHMKEAGVNLVSISPMHTTHSLGDCYSPYPPTWLWDETYDFSSLDRQIEDVLSKHPDAKIVSAIDLNSPLWLAKRLNLDSFCSLTACSLEPKWMELTTKYLHAFLDYTETKYADRIAGYIIACGRTMEWIDPSYFTAESQKSAYYETWCKKNNRPVLPIPNANELKSAKHGFVRDPQTEAHVIQWIIYANDLMTELAVHFISETRKRIRKDKKIGIFYGALMHTMATGQHETERLFDTAPPDFAIGASCNSRRYMGDTSGYVAPIHTLRRRGIDYLHEIDRITSTTNRNISPFISISGPIWDAWKNPQDDVAGLRREMSLSLINRFHLWWFNIWGKSYASAEVQKALVQMKQIWDKYAHLSTGSSAQVLYVLDPESNYYVNYYDHPRQYFLAHEIRNAFSRVALPFDTATWKDLEFIDLKQYRMVIFQNSVLNSDEREKIYKKVCSESRLVVWFHAAGIIRNGSWNPEFMKELTGYKFGESEHAIRKHDGYRSAYFAECTELSDELLRSLAEQAGVHLYTPVGNALWQSAKFLMVHRAGAAEVPVTLPQKFSKVTELFSGKVVAENTDRFTASFADSGTMLFYFEK